MNINDLVSGNRPITEANCPFSETNDASTCNSNSNAARGARTYRSNDGTCNNLVNSAIGSNDTPFKRFLAPVYQDGRQSPRTVSATGRNPLPNPRAVSLTISNTRRLFEPRVSHLVPSFGQFLAHDMTSISPTVDSNGDPIDCVCNSGNPICMSYTTAQNIAVSTNTCVKFTRSSASFSDLSCNRDHREQLNQLSSYLDSGTVYGKDDERASQLRTFSNGQLLASEGISANRDLGLKKRSYLPFDTTTCSADAQAAFKCFLAGESRTSENLALVSVHTLFFREHNRIATELHAINPRWSDEKLYQEARRIVNALQQHITYNEWLPVVTGNRQLAPLRGGQYFSGYDSTVNPALANEFATAAFRFGHSLIVDDFNFFNKFHQDITPGRGFPYGDIIEKSDFAYLSSVGGLNSILVGTLNEKAWKFGSFGDFLQNHLFETRNATTGETFAFDLLATNILRGRDHGLPPYVQYVKFCHNIDITDFRQLDQLMVSSKRESLQRAYQNVADIDLYAGGLLETPTNGAVMGPTFKCIIEKQFADLKRGDRFYYENGQDAQIRFTQDQLIELRKVTIARLICDNYDVATIATNPFHVQSGANQRVDCSAVGRMDLSKWLNA